MRGPDGAPPAKALVALEVATVESLRGLCRDPTGTILASSERQGLLRVFPGVGGDNKWVGLAGDVLVGSRARHLAVRESARASKSQKIKSAHLSSRPEP